MNLAFNISGSTWYLTLTKFLFFSPQIWKFTKPHTENEKIMKCATLMMIMMPFGGTSLLNMKLALTFSSTGTLAQASHSSTLTFAESSTSYWWEHTKGFISAQASLFVLLKYALASSSLSPCVSPISVIMCFYAVCFFTALRSPNRVPSLKCSSVCGTIRGLCLLCTLCREQHSTNTCNAHKKKKAQIVEMQRHQESTVGVLCSHARLTVGSPVATRRRRAIDRC